MTLTSPAPGRAITSPYGWRIHPIMRVRAMHRGRDYGGSFSVRAAADGVVVTNGAMLSKVFGLGYYVIVQHSPTLRTLYAHGKSRSKLAVGQKVKRGQVVFPSGSTGASTGNHLHFEVHTPNRFRVWTHTDPGPHMTTLGALAEDALHEEEEEMTIENYVDTSTMVKGKYVNGTKCMTVFPSGAIVHTPRVIPSPSGVTDEAVQMSRLYGAHQEISHDLYEKIVAAHDITQRMRA